MVYHRRKADVLKASEQLHEALAAIEAEAMRKGTVSPQLVEAVATALVRSFDAVHGGFGRGPKFPMGSPLALVLRLYAEQRDAQLLAMAAIVLDQLAALTNEPRYRQRAEQLLEVFAGRAPEYGRFGATYALAVDLHLHPPAHAVIIGSRGDARTQALWRAALSAFRPGKLVASYDPALAKPTDLPPPVAAAMQATQTTDAGPTAYVCVGTTCSLPTSEPEAVATLVTTFQRRGPQ